MGAILRPLRCAFHYLGGNRLATTRHRRLRRSTLQIQEHTMNTTARRLVTSFNTPSTLLRHALLADATLTSIAGIVLVLAARPLGVFLNLEPAMLEIAGLIFFPVGAFAGWLGTRPRVHRSLVIVMIVLNALWAVDSVLML